MHYTPTKMLKARKSHRCTSCAEPIAPGEEYVLWVSFDDSAFTNKMHPECHSAHQSDAEYTGSAGSWEYTPYSYPRGSADA